MTRRFNFLCAFSLMMLFSVVAFAQPSSSADFSQTSELSLTKEPKSKYPPKPKDMWELSIHAGPYLIGSDVVPRWSFPGFGVGVGVRKSLNYTWSLRGDFIYNQSEGLDYFTSSPGNKNEQDAGYSTTNPVVHNYQNTKSNIALEVLANLSNLKFHSSGSKLGIYVVAGIGARFGTVKHDLLNGTTPYNFTSILAGIDVSDAAGRSSARDALKNALDGTYESEFDIAPTTSKTSLAETITTHFGIGLSYRIADKMSLSIEPQLIYQGADAEDGLRVSNYADASVYVPLRLGFFLGDKNKKSVPLWWVNPLDEPYAAIAANTKKKDAAEMFVDKDNDGVPDAIDKEQDTPAGAEVDTRGVTLDSDKDGLANHLDKEPYSPVGWKIDPSTGISKKPETPKTLSEADVVRIGKSQKWDEKPVVTGNTTTVKDWFLPMIHFDLDKTKVKSQYYSALAHVATVLKNYPSVNVVVEGHADASSSVRYNLGLSYKRAENAINFLTSNYGISRDRLILRYNGETAPLVPNAPNNYMNRRVEFSVAKGGETNMSSPQ